MNWITALGLTAALMTAISFIPQAVKIIKTKHTKDLSLNMYVALNIGVFMWLIYGILVKDLPIIFANAITFSFTLTILVLKIKYK